MDDELLDDELDELDVPEDEDGLLLWSIAIVCKTTTINRPTRMQFLFRYFM